MDWGGASIFMALDSVGWVWLGFVSSIEMSWALDKTYVAGFGAVGGLSMIISISCGFVNLGPGYASE